MSLDGFSLLALILVALAVTTVAMGFKVVPQGSELDAEAAPGSRGRAA